MSLAVGSGRLTTWVLPAKDLASTPRYLDTQSTYVVEWQQGLAAGMPASLRSPHDMTPTRLTSEPACVLRPTDLLLLFSFFSFQQQLCAHIVTGPEKPYYVLAARGLRGHDI